MDWLKEKAKSLLFSLLGLVLVLGWWTLRGAKDDPNHTSAQSIPAIFWEGGTNKLKIVADTTTSSLMRISLETPLPDDPEDNRWHEATEKIEAGNYTYAIQFPANAHSGMIELVANNPAVGAKLHWVVELNDKVIQEDEDTLDKPLAEHYSMFLQLELAEFLQSDPE